jgi:hypothetical protein
MVKKNKRNSVRLKGRRLKDFGSIRIADYQLTDVAVVKRKLLTETLIKNEIGKYRTEV